MKLKEKKVLKKINSKNNILNYYIWKNNKDKQNYIIQFNKDSITIFCPFLEKDLFDEIKIDELKGDNNSGCIIYNKNNTDILCILNEKGNFIFYDLYNKNVIFMIKIKDNNLMQICTYNKKYLIAVSETGFILIIDYELKKIINKINWKNLKFIKTIKIIKHNILGEYLLLSGFPHQFLIFQNKNNFI